MSAACGCREESGSAGVLGPEISLLRCDGGPRVWVRGLPLPGDAASVRDEWRHDVPWLRAGAARGACGSPASLIAAAGLFALGALPSVAGVCSPAPLAVAAAAAAPAVGTVTEFAIPTGGVPSAITRGPDGNLWFTVEKTGTVGRITPTGTITVVPE